MRVNAWNHVGIDTRNVMRVDTRDHMRVNAWDHVGIDTRDHMRVNAWDHVGIDTRYYMWVYTRDGQSDGPKDRADHHKARKHGDDAYHYGHDCLGYLLHQLHLHQLLCNPVYHC